MSETNTITGREAVLASLLLHASLIIIALLFPDAFVSRGVQSRVPDPDVPIPLAFLQGEPEPAPRTSSIGDRGNEDRSDPRSRKALPPTSEDPYSIGNNPNRFLAPPVPAEEPPAPEQQDPGHPAQPGDASPGQNPLPGSSPAQDDREPAGLEEGFLVPPSGNQTARDGKPDRGRALKEALGRMSTGMTGGPPLRYDNPVGGLSGPAGGLSFDTPGFDWGPYARRIYWIIWTNWTQGWPPAARAGLTGITTVRFRIHRDGRVAGIRIIEPSGTLAFDRCATLALEASDPLPPLPEDFPGESEGITARFLYNLRTGDR